MQEMGAATLDAAAAALIGNLGKRVGVDFSENGDAVILLVDRIEQKTIEMRASRTGTIVEPSWKGEVEQRLAWAVDNGNLDAPGLPPATGKNLYH